MMRRSSMVFALCLPAFVTAANAETVKVDGVSAALELPSGYCKLSRRDPVEKSMYELQDRVQAGHNIVVMIAFPCEKIKALHKGVMSPQYAIWLMQAPKGTVTRIPDSVDRRSVLDIWAKTIPKFETSELVGDIERRAQREGKKIKIDSTGVIGRDDNAVYLGLAGMVTRRAGEESIASVTGMTLLSNRFFSLNLYDRFESRATFDQLLTKAKDALARAVSLSATMAPDKSFPPGMQPVKPAPNRPPLREKPQEQASL